MPYPDNPFEETFDSRLIIGLNEEKSSNATLKEEYEKTLRWLCSAPKITTYRVNLLKSNTDEVIEKIQEILDPNLGRIETHPLIANVVVIHHNFDQKNKLEKYDKEIVVDVQCAAAILRGAHIYAPGVLGMMSGTQSGDKVSIYVDTRSKCKKGLQKLYEDEGKIFIGNGIARMMRYELFGENITQRGVAVEVKETISGCPSTGDEFLPQGAALLQNLPSILCIHALDPQPHETILDMCAAPGNKTTHIAELMQNKGNLVAIDKTLKKTTQLKARCDDFGAKVLVFDADSTNIVYSDSCVIRCLQDGPPFPSDTFDRILLDAPCSVLGKRPQFANRISEKVVKSYVPLQRKLFKTKKVKIATIQSCLKPFVEMDLSVLTVAAVELLKVNGTLVYSTCTITLAENEGMVAWALRTFPYLKLTKAKIQLGGSGWQGTALKEEERMLVQRFGPDQEVDSIGFFFACFTKTGQNT